MAINLARLGRIQTPNEPEESVLSMIGRQREEARRAKRDEQVAALNLAKLTEDAAERKRVAKEAADTRQVMGDYLTSRGTVENAPIGVVNPKFLGKAPIETAPTMSGPQRAYAYQTPRDTSSLESEAVVNLAKVNPMAAEEFRKAGITERQGAEDRTRKIAREDEEDQAARDKVAADAAAAAWERAFKERQQKETERSNAANEFVKRIVAGKAATAKPTADQNTYANYGRRLMQAEQDLNTLADSGFDRTNPIMGLYKRLPNIFQPGNLQQQNQAERNFVNAVLRRESGAVISPSEFENAEKQYFPRSGDSKEVLAQKKRNRELVINNFKNLSGPAWGNAGGDVAPVEQPIDPNDWEVIK